MSIDISKLYSERIGGALFGKETELFKFEKIKQAKREAVKIHPEMNLIDLGVGEPDAMADMGIVEMLYAEASNWENRGYADNGITEFQIEAAKYLERVFQVKGIDPGTEVIHSIGSKSALSLIPQAFINPGDVTLMTVPGYPIMGTKTEWLGGEVYPLPLIEEHDFLPDLNAIPKEILQRAKLLYINYPNNPTGKMATKQFFEYVVSFAKKNEILVVQDAAYSALTFGGVKPLSFLSIPGAKEIGVEVHSLSKSFNMTGWRLGFVAGNQQMIDAIKKVKDNNDSGQFKAIQMAGVYALKHPEITIATCEKYERRHQKLSKLFRKIGFQATTSDATFYEYMQIPKGTKDGVIFENAEQFSEYLIKNQLISTVPWDDTGHYIRASVTFVADTLEEEDGVFKELNRRLQNCHFIF